MGLTIKWDITYKCNLFCKHCINGELLNNRAKEIDLTDIKVIIDKIDEETKIDYVHMLGGEPTVRGDFLEICEHFEERKINFGFNTNCVKFNDKWLDILLNNKNFRSLVVSIEGPNPTINDSIRGKDVYNNIIENVKKIISYKKRNNFEYPEIKVNTVVSKANKEYICEMFDLCVSLGVDKLDLLQLIEQGNAKEQDVSLTFEEELNLVRKVGEKYSEVKDRLQVNAKFVRPIAKIYCEKVLKLDFPSVEHGCMAGTKFSFMNNRGEIYPCDRFLSHHLKGNNRKEYNLVNRNFKEVWGKDEFNIIYERTMGNEFEQKCKPCNKCAFFRKTCFPCCFLFDNKLESYIMTRCQKYFDLIEIGE